MRRRDESTAIGGRLRQRCWMKAADSDTLTIRVAPEVVVEDAAIAAVASSVARLFLRIQYAQGFSSDVIKGTDPRLLVVVGPMFDSRPCGCHRVCRKATDDASVAEQWRDELLILDARLLFRKPRTTVGWKGLINDPHLNDSFDINTGCVSL